MSEHRSVWVVGDCGWEEEYPTDIYSARDAVEDYVAGAYEATAEEGTMWVTVRVWPRTYDKNGEIITDERDESERHTVAVEPCEPECPYKDGHMWSDEPVVLAHGGGVYIHEVCTRCGMRRITDTWAQDRGTGQQGLRSVRYERGYNA